MIIFFIFGGVIFFGSETAEILEIFSDAEEGRGSYVNRWLRWKCLGEAQGFGACHVFRSKLVLAS